MNGSGAPCQGAGRKWGLQPGAEAEDGEGFPLPARDPRAGTSVPLPPSRAERRLGALLLPAAMVRALLGWGVGGGNARPVTMATVAPGKPEVGAVEGPLPHADAAWREAACPPTRLCHSISVFTKGEQ